MRIGMVSEFTAKRFHTFDFIRKTVDFFAYHKECGFGVVFFKTVEKSVSKRTWTVIESQSNIFVCFFSGSTGLCPGGLGFGCGRWCCFFCFGFVALQRAIVKKFVALAVHGDDSGLHDSIQIHVVTPATGIYPSGLHDPVFIEVVFLSVCICQPSGVRFAIHHKKPAASTGSPDTRSSLIGNFDIGSGRRFCRNRSGCLRR